MRTEEFERLVSGYEEGDLPEAEVVLLRTALTTRSDLLDVFVSRCVLEAELYRRGEMGVVMEAGMAEQVWGRSSGRQWLGSLAAAAALLLLGAVVLYKTHVSNLPPYAEIRTSPHAMVSVAGSEEPPTAGTLSKGSTLTVTQGSAEVTLAEGVRCVVQAPGRLRFSKRGELRLMEGAARFQVEPQAHGFRVMTENLVVVDLGTDFAVDLALPDQPQVHVMAGKVEVQGISGRRELMTVTGGSAVALGAVGKLQPIPLEAKRYPGNLPKGIPAVYFSFDEQEGGVLPARGSLAEQAGVHVSLGHERTPRVGEGRFGKGLEFSGTDSYAKTNWMGIGGAQVRSIALWVRIDPGSDANSFPLLGWGEWTAEPKMSNFGLRVGGDSSGAAVLRVVSGRRWLQGTTPLADGRWHHVAVCMGAYSKHAWPETTIFVDGVAEDWTARMPMEGEVGPLDTFSTNINGYYSQPLTMGRFGDPAEPAYLPSFQGQLDEVIVAAGVLTGEQVKALYEGRLEESGLDLGK